MLDSSVNISEKMKEVKVLRKIVDKMNMQRKKRRTVQVRISKEIYVRLKVVARKENMTISRKLDFIVKSGLKASDAKN